MDNQGLDPAAMVVSRFEPLFLSGLNSFDQSVGLIVQPVSLKPGAVKSSLSVKPGQDGRSAQKLPAAENGLFRNSGPLTDHPADAIFKCGLGGLERPQGDGTGNKH